MRRLRAASWPLPGHRIPKCSSYMISRTPKWITSTCIQSCVNKSFNLCSVDILQSIPSSVIGDLGDELDVSDFVQWMAKFFDETLETI
jgi:hypothetical protein